MYRVGSAFFFNGCQNIPQHGAIVIFPGADKATESQVFLDEFQASQG
jgi:hypothetical protein